MTDSKEVLILINGHNKARALAATVEGGVSQKWTCSTLQMHNGAIDIESTLNVGTTVLIHLPIQRQEGNAERNIENEQQG